MPGRVNGVGTTYIGRKDVRTRPGICEHCGRVVQLSSYETQLWFTVIYIPVIPLGRRQIIDYCPACTFHRATSVAEWAHIKEQVLRDNVARASGSPDDPVPAMRLHESLSAFQQDQEADQMADAMERKFPNSVDVLLYLGAWRRRSGQAERASALYLRVLELVPNHPGARRAAAITFIESGRPDRAWDMIRPGPAAGSADDFLLLVLLADTYGRAGNHGKALDVRRFTLERFPAAARDGRFRRAVRASERAAGVRESMLPPLRSPRVLAIGIPAAAVAVAALLMLLNWFLSSYQTLHVANGFADPINISIDGRAPVRVEGMSRREMFTAEGSHRAVVSRPGAPDETVQFEVANTLIERFTRDGIFVLNPGGAATLLWEETVYSTQPDPSYANPYQLHFMKKFMTFRGIDYPFGDFPGEIRLESGNSGARKSRLEMIEATPADILAWAADRLPDGQTTAFAEYHLRLNPRDDALLAGYVGLCGDRKALERCRDFLKGLLDVRPVPTQLHRACQDVCKATGQEDSVVPLWDRFLAENPGDSALLYLRGRAAVDSAEALSYYDRAIAADRRNPYPHMARGFLCLMKADLAAARAFYETACSLRPGDTEMGRALFGIRCGLGEYAALEKDLKAAQDEFPLDAGVEEKLFRLYGARGEPAKAESEWRDYIGKYRKVTGRNDDQLNGYLQVFVLCLQARNDEALALLDRQKSIDKRTLWRALIAVEKGDARGVEKCTEGWPSGSRAYYYLLLSSSLGARGESAGASHWRAEAVGLLAAGMRDDRRAADLLRKTGDVDMGEVDEVMCQPHEKAVFLVALAQGCPSRRSDLLARARKLTGFCEFGAQRVLADAVAAMEK